jgi:hypothetical protein
MRQWAKRTGLVAVMVAALRWRRAAAVRTTPRRCIDDPSGGTGATVRLLTYDSFALPEEAAAAFERGPAPRRGSRHRRQRDDADRRAAERGRPRG